MKYILIITICFSTLFSCKEKGYYPEVKSIERASRYLWLDTEEPWAYGNSYERVIEMNLPAASRRGIMMDYFYFFSPQGAGNLTQRD